VQPLGKSAMHEPGGAQRFMSLMTASFVAIQTAILAPGGVSANHPVEVISA
jgi:hypothetical protein